MNNENENIVLIINIINFKEKIDQTLLNHGYNNGHFK